MVGRKDRCAVAPHAGGQCAEFSLCVQTDVGEPDVEVQVFVAPFPHQLGQAAGVFGGRGQCGAAFTQVVEALALGIRELLGPTHDPVGDTADGQLRQRGIRREHPGAIGP